MQHSTVINLSIFQVIIAVWLYIALVIGKISYDDRLGARHCRILVLDTKHLLQNFRKRAGSFAQ